MEFRCRLATASGEISEGVFVADSESHLRFELEHKGFCVLALRPRQSIGGLSLPWSRRRRVPQREFLMFNQELATLLKAGMPLVQSLDILRGRITSPVFRSVLDDVHEKVRAGAALSEAFLAHGELFSGVYTASLMAGEKSGNLEGVLRRFVVHMKVLSMLRRRTVSALTYPAVLVGLSLAVLSILVFHVIPTFADFYHEFNAELPLITRVIVTGSTFLRSGLLFILLGLVIVVVAVVQWLRSPDHRLLVDRVLLRLPLLGPIALKFSVSQVARTLATLLGGGIPLVNAIDVAGRSMANRFLAREFLAAGERVREGESFAAALEARRAFPTVAIKMAEVGESTGALQDMLNSLADFYDEEVDTDVSRFVQLLEPALLVVMGLVIASFLLALYMPLFQISSVVH